MLSIFSQTATYNFIFNFECVFIPGTPLLTMRSRLPLTPLLPYSEAENPEFKVPKFTTDPKAVGYFDDMKHGTNIPGNGIFISNIKISFVMNC